MANFTIKGDGDEVAAQLKAKFDADDAQFNAQLDAMFKTTSAPPKQQPAAATPSQSTSGWGDTTSRKPTNGGSMRSRLSR